MDQFPPSPWVYHWGRFEFFRKFAEILRCTTGVVDTGGNLPLVSLTLAAILPPVSLTPVTKLPPVSTTQAVLLAKFAVVDNDGKFATGVIDTGSAPSLSNISANFREKNSKWPQCYFRGLGGDDLWKNTWNKSRENVPLSDQVSFIWRHMR